MSCTSRVTCSYICMSGGKRFATQLNSITMTNSNTSTIQRNGRLSLAVPSTSTPQPGGPRRASAPSAPVDPASLAAHAKAGWYRRTVHKEADADLDLLALFVSEGHDPSDAGRMLRLNENDEHLSRLALEHVAHVKRGDKFKPLYCPVCDRRDDEAAA